MTRDEIKTLQAFLAGKGLYTGAIDGIRGPLTRAAEAASMRATTEPSMPSVGSHVRDCRDDYTGKIYPARDWAAVDTVCLHQMACKGSIGWKRWTGLAAHWAVCCDAVAAWLIDFDRRVPHGHGWNGRSVGFEIEGHYAGIEGDPETHGVPKGATGERAVPMVLGGPVIDAALDAIRFTVARVAERGGKIRYMVAHRQSYGVKVSDPGEAIWKQIALVAMAEHGLVGLPPVGTRKPIPEAWGGASGVPY